MQSGLERLAPGLAGANAHCRLEIENEDLAVADFVGAGRFLQGFDHPLLDVVGDGQFDLGFGQEIDGVFGPTIDLCMALLAPETLDLAHGHALDAELGQRLADGVKHERLDDGDHIFHVTTLPSFCCSSRLYQRAAPPMPGQDLLVDALY
jgi:hypothetical protein